MPLDTRSREGTLAIVLTAVAAACSAGIRAPQDAPMFLAAGPAGLVGVGADENGVIAAWLGVDLEP